MRYMMIVKANPDSEAGVMPASEELATMGRYNEELINAGVLLVAGFWIIDVKDYEEALAWAKKIPFEHGEEVEIRKVAEASDFPSDSVSEDALRKEQAWREANQRPITN
jgi:hypothetical protein